MWHWFWHATIPLWVVILAIPAGAAVAYVALLLWAFAKNPIRLG